MAKHSVVKYVEEWRTEEDLRLRVNADTFVQLITLMEESVQPPQIEFALAGGTRGIEFVEEVRGERIHG